MITSAGCNALDYLLDDPAEIHAVDMNARQNALLDLKRAILATGDHERLFALFGDGASPRYRSILESVRHTLSAPAQAYWERRADYFDPGGTRGSFYYRGGSGLAAWLLRNAIVRGSRRHGELVDRLLNAPDRGEQRAAFSALEPVVWSGVTRWLVRQPSVMALLGVPRPQIRLILESHPGGLVGFVRDKLRHVMAELPIAENYFWRVYMTGRYTRSCCPNYLRREFAQVLAQRVDRIATHTTTVSGFLRDNPGDYTHFVLLDHQDWLAAHDPEALREEWELIFANSRPGSRVLLRSAAPDLSFVPKDIAKRLRWDTATAARLHPIDRVGTYGSMHVGEVL
ncbi:MAG: BtaA family protein [Phycisphaerae bacterium]|jgi:S-adenosylmethionine-diacylglycerol 3-amino-3-carboxypropyl transferase|nr:BtaA family protein [Phycisphaerae bacterium]